MIIFILQMRRVTSGFPTVFRIPTCQANLAPVGLAEAPVLLLLYIKGLMGNLEMLQSWRELLCLFHLLPGTTGT